MKRCLLLTALLGWLCLTPQTLLAQFECGAPVAYQGHNYATVQIGDQCWFAENLRSENYENGDAIQILVRLPILELVRCTTMTML